MNNKHKLTATIFENIPDEMNPWHDRTLDSLVSDWWMTKRSPSCYRLSDTGNRAFQLAEIQGYEFPLKLTEKDQYTSLFKRGLLSKKINCPYFIGLKNQRVSSAYIIVYDSRVAMMITLYGNILEYLKLK